MKRSNFLLIGMIFCGLLSCTKTEYIEIERIVEQQIEVKKEDTLYTNKILKLDNQNALIATNEWNGICHG